MTGAARFGRWRWFCDHRESFPDDTRVTLMRTLVDRTSPLILASISVTLLALLIDARLPTARWATLWLGVEIVFLFGRLRLMRRASAALTRNDCGPFYLNTIIGTLWCLSVGVGTCACVLTGDGILAALAAINVAGVTAGISTRSAAFPRLAILQICLVGGPYAIGAACAPSPWFIVLAVEIVMCLAAMSSLALTHHTDSINLIRAERENRFLAFHDALTGLPNRKRLHPAGDQLLIAVAARLSREIRQTDIVARVGGDEFVILLPDADEAEAARCCGRIIASVNAPYTSGFQLPVTVGVTIGSARAPHDGVLGTVLLSRADQALYAAKRLRRGTHLAYSPPNPTGRASAEAGLA
jgi:GGDEF domain-containing protein